MSDKDQQIAQFVAVTGVDGTRARFYLESAAWNLDVAMESFYDDGGADDPPDIVEAPAPQAAATGTAGKPASASSRFGTISSFRDDKTDSDEEGEAFYAGGSEHGGGQQVLGPPKKKKNTDALVEDMFKAAKEHGAEEVAAGPSSEKKPGPLFKGTGYRLGDEEGGQSHMVMGAPVNQAPKQVDMILKLWKDGFSVDNGELRDYRDPNNKQFLDAIHKGEVPQELIGMAKGGEVNLNMEDHRNEDFVKPKVQLKAFSGEGHMLGSPTPNMAPPSGGASAAPATNVNVDQSKPITQLQLRLADGTRLVGKFNHSHTVADVRKYIISNRPDLVNANFVLMTTFPNKELTDESVTLEDAKLLNAVIVQRNK